jgi:hypothetical protein
MVVPLTGGWRTNGVVELENSSIKLPDLSDCEASFLVFELKFAEFS